MIKETTWREQNDEFSTPVIIGSAICCFLLFSLIFFSCCIARKRRTRAFECLFRRVLAISINWPCDGRFHFVDFGIVFCAMYIVLFSCPYDSPVFFFFFYTLFIVHRHADFVYIRVLTNVRACKSHLFVKRTGLHVYMHSGHDRYTRSRSDLSRTSITTPSSLTFKLCSRCDRSRFYVTNAH